jgi:hypothetical protein
MIGNKLKNLKHELDPYISEGNIFTEKDKKKIRVKILESKFQKKKQVRWMPILATGVAACLFAVLITTFIGNKMGTVPLESKDFGTNVNDLSDSQNGGVTEVEPTRTIIDPKTIKEGDIINGLVVTSLSGNLLDKQNDPIHTFRISTEGQLTLEGTFQVIADETEGERVIFLPDKESLLKIPVFADYEAEPFIIINNPFQEVSTYLNLTPGGKKQAEITINHYMFYDDPQSGQFINRAHLETINDQAISDRIEQVEVTKEYPLLKEELIPIYEKLISKREDSLLKGLEPNDVFQLYWQAFEYGNLEMRYFLLGGEDLPDMLTFTEKFVEKNLEREQATLDKIKNAGDLEVTVTGNSAYVLIDGTAGEKVEMIKNANGVWKLKFIE